MPSSKHRKEALQDELGLRFPSISVAHIWSDYVPQSFIELHPFLLDDFTFHSVNLVERLWDNGKTSDENTHYLRRLDVKNLYDPDPFFRLRRRLFRAWDQKQFRAFCLDRVRAFGSQIIHSHFGTTGCELAEDFGARNLPHIVTLYGYDASASLRDPATLRKYQRMFHFASKIVVLCEQVRNRIEAAGCPREKIVVWNMPAGIERYPFQPKALREQASPLRLVMAARFAEAKGHTYALQAVQLLKERGRKVEITFVGYGNRSRGIQNEIDARGLSPIARIVDTKLSGNFHETYRQILAESDAFVLPSTTDSQGTDEAGPALTMVCAQSMGLPVVCTRFPGSEISLVDGVTGLFARERDALSLADRIEHLSFHPKEAARMGQQGSRLVAREFTASKQTMALKNLYREVLGWPVASQRPAAISSPEAPARWKGDHEPLPAQERN